MPQAVGHPPGFPDRPCVKNSLCVIFQLGRLQVTTTSFAYYIIALSVLLQAFVFVSVGAMADYGRYRKKMLTISTVVGSAFAIMILTVVRPQLYWLAAIYTIIMNIAFGTAMVFYNAYLPLLVHNYHAHAETVETLEEIKTTSQESVASMALSESGKLRKVDNISSYISTRGFIWGYLGALIVLAISAFYVSRTDGSFIHLEMCVALCGVWWLLFSIPSIFGLKTRPGPDLPPGTNYIAFSWKKVFRTLRKCRKLPVTFWYLLCFCLFSDGYATMGSVAVIFASTEMGVSSDKLIIAVLIAPFSSVLGNLFFYGIQKVTKLSSRALLIILLGLMGMVPVWGLAGLFTKVIGLHNQWEIYLFSVYFGFLIGAIQSYSRVIFSELIPPGDESEFFSLYAITDKGSSWLGPLFQSLLLNITGNPRAGLFVLAAMIWVPIPILLAKVDMSRGVKDAKAFHSSDISMEELEGQHMADQKM